MSAHLANRTGELNGVFFVEFIDALNKLRVGQLDEVTVQLFKSLARRVRYADGIEPTDL